MARKRLSGHDDIADVRDSVHSRKMRSLSGLIGLSGILFAVGIAVAAAFYALVPGYQILYYCTLVLALMVAIPAFRFVDDPEQRGPAGAILAGCVIYWTLGGSVLPEWVNGGVLLFLPLIIGVAVVRLWKKRRWQPVKGS